ncbi:MAG TPA: transcriptional regulator [Lachnospiraceae bacterium]|nr:transcriptional regulator [Lachnospiraceae bacterium]
MENKKISDAELEIMKIIWTSNCPLMFAQITDALQNTGINWQKNTLITLLSRLMDKGYLKANKRGRKNEYIPLITEQEFQSVQTKNFVDRVYKGDVQGLVAQLVNSEMLTETEYAELKKILEVE